MTWLQGRGDIVYRSQKPLRLRGDVTVAPDGFAIDAMKAEIDGGAVEGRVAVSHRQTGSGSRVDAQLKAERLDLDAATALVRSLAGPQAEWPDEGTALARCRPRHLGRTGAASAGRQTRLRAEDASLDRLKIGQPDSVTLEGAGNFDRVNATGKLALDSSAASLNQLTALISPFAPSLAARLDAMGTSPGPASVKLALDLDKIARQPDRANARAVVDLEAPQLKGMATITAKPAVAAIYGIDLEALRRSDIGMETKCIPEQGRPLVALLGLDRTDRSR